MIDKLRLEFPKLSSHLANNADIEEILPPASKEDITNLEQQLGITLPVSYKKFLRVTRGFWLNRGIFQMNSTHPFFHDWSGSRLQKWPPTQGMICFAEYFLEADGDQILFDVKQGLIDEEYPVYYYAHDDPYNLKRIADSFQVFIENVLIKQSS